MELLHEVWKGPDQFRWQPSQTPLASDKAVIISCVSYLAVIGGLRWIIRIPIILPRIIPALHNAILCLSSLIMFVGTGLEVFKVLHCFLSANARHLKFHTFAWHAKEITC